ncbi:hypothetical protein FB45DRAFT_327379 [Roridomyces roridus]|uniref:Pre-mRNA polyadenylation factor Fip1 domain-containing protein n=1 Tax=Roridomyces roridus TaxID=1738132 RepID=A0AAD7FBS7_9AGAR|nr:hypothetical protein FB45DRAFT_327379 [Roridomyces roridus]
MNASRERALVWQCLTDFLSSSMDDEDDFLYGNPPPTTTPAVVTPSPALASSSFQSAAEGIIANLQAQAAAEASTSTSSSSQPAASASTSMAVDAPEDGEEEDASDMGEETEDDEEDVEIIMEPQSRSLDFRQSRGLRPSASTPALRAPQPSLTTEYTPIQRVGSTATIAPSRSAPQVTSTPASEPVTSVPTPVPQTEAPPQPSPENVAAVAVAATPAVVEDGIDPSTLPPATAPPSHPAIDPTVMGTMDGRAIIDVDLAAMTDKQWRKPGADVSDWFNYGFDELSWEIYCYRRRDLGEMANVLKTNVLVRIFFCFFHPNTYGFLQNFSGMPEDQLTQLPSDVRTMVMTGTAAMMNNAAGGAGMMNPGMMMDMSMMGPMGMDMGHGHGMMPMAMQGEAQVVVPGAAGEMQDGNGAFGGMMEYNEAGQQQQQQQMYVEGAGGAPAGPGGVGRGGPVGAAAYRARGMRGVRGAGFVGGLRGRGHAPSAPARPTSPLPPNVPTGPRNQNKYKDRDGISTAVDGLDYGGGKEARTSSGEPEDRGSRKRRSSPGLDDVRGSKRR